MNATINSVFSQRLKELRGDRKIQDISSDLGINRATLGYYEDGKRHPDANILKRIADYYDVSLDYLVGITDTKSRDIEIQNFCSYTGLSEKALEILHRYQETKKYLEDKAASSEAREALKDLSGAYTEEIINNLYRINVSLVNTINAIICSEKFVFAVSDFISFDKITSVTVLNNGRSAKHVIDKVSMINDSQSAAINGTVNIDDTIVKTAILKKIEKALETIKEELTE